MNVIGEISEENKDSLFWKVAQGVAEQPNAARLLGMQVLEVDPNSGRLTTQFLASPEFTNPMGYVQGGFLSAMLDDTLAPCVLATLAPDQVAITQSLTVNYVSPCQTGAVMGQAQIQSRSGGTAFVTGTLHQGNALIATANAVVLVRKVG